MNYKLVKEDEHSFHVQHPDGSTFPIAKAHIGPEVHKRIKALEPVKMSNGGIAGATEASPEEPMASEMPTPENPADAIAAATPVQSPDMQKLDEYKKFYSNESVNRTPDEVERLAQNRLLQDKRAENYAQNMQQQEQARKAHEDMAYNQEAAQYGLPLRQMPGATIAGPAPASQGAPQAAQPDLLTASLDAQRQGLAAEQGINTKAAQQVGGIYGQMAQNAQQLQKDIAANDAHYAPIEADLQAKNQQLFQGVLDSKIDHNRVWSEMGAGNKILAALSVALSGIGSGLTGKSNLAMDVIQKTIDRDIHAQEAELGKKQTLFSENLRQLGDLRAARAATQSQLLSIASAKGQMLAAQMGSVEAQQRYALANNAISVKTAELNNQAALFSGMAKGGGGSPDQLISYLRVTNPAMAKEMESRHIPGVGLAAVPLSDKAREEIISRQSLQEQVQNLRQWAQQHGGSVNPQDIAYGKGLANSVQDAYRRANGQGVFREAEADFVKGIVADDPTAFFNKMRTDPKYKALEDSNLMQLNGIKKSYGLPVSQAGTGTGAVERTTPDGRVALFNPMTKKFLGYK